MTKRCIIIVSLCVFCLSSCYIPYEPPYGVWLSECGALMFDIGSRGNGPYPGVYIKDGEEIDVKVGFGFAKEIIIMDANDSQLCHYIFDFKVKDNKLYGFIGDETIFIFNKIGAY